MTAGLICGCAEAPPRQPMLLANDATLPAPAPGAKRALLVLRMVDLPEYLDRKQLLYRGAQSELQHFPDVEWAERLSVSVTRWLALQLGADLPDCEVAAFVAPSDQSPASALYVSLESFEPLQSGGGAILRLRGTWHLSGEKPASGRLSADVRMSRLDSAADIVAMQTALAQVADAIAAAARPLLPTP
jgi:uncharacterized lipoprotein YmbA